MRTRAAERATDELTQILAAQQAAIPAAPVGRPPMYLYPPTSFLNPWQGVMLQMQQQSQSHSQQASSVQTAQEQNNKRHRTSFNVEQLCELEKAFNHSPYPNSRDRESLAKRTNLSEARVQVCFYYI